MAANQEVRLQGLRRARALPALLPRQGLLRPLAALRLALDLAHLLAGRLARPSSLLSRRPTRARLT
jgi:hypothetical protein